MRFRFILIIIFSHSLKLFSTNEIIVAKDGSGDFTTINAALNSIPSNNAEWKTIIVKNGIYDEHVMIKANYIALVGESRGGTRIEHNIPRAAWYAINGSNTGTGVVNIATNLHDIIIANMYIRNTFEGSEDYTEVIRSETGTTRLWFINLDVLCLWKDTFAPWGKAGGMYYVSDCNFRGSIDAFCPRGYCYAINSRYTETKSSSPIWHEGVAGEDQKLVIQGGSVHSEYNKNVKLQNSQNYAKFYYLDLALSDSITSLGSGATAYFYGVTGLAGLTWFANSISLEQRKLIDAAWTFDGKWDPENTMPSVLPFAALPQPYNGRYAVSTGSITLKWIPARNALSHKVYFGTTDTPPLIGETSLSSYEIPNLEKNTTYYWKIVTVSSTGETTFGTWRFTTSDNINPVQHATLTLVGNNKQTIMLGESIAPVKYKMTGATQFSVSGLPLGVTSELKTDSIIISGKPENAGTFTYSVTTTDAIQNTTATGYFIVKNPNDTTSTNTGDTIPTDYSLSRLNKFITKLDCKIMTQEPAWITKSGSVAWTSGTGYKWGSTSAILTLKVNGCTSVECTFTNSSTSRPIIISDGGSGNEKTAYPTAANSETLVIFTPKNTGDDDITIKTSGSSGLTVTKLVFSGIYSAVQYVFDKNIVYKLENGSFSCEKPVDIYAVSGKLLHKNVESCNLEKGIYIILNNGNRSKIICN